MFHTGVGVYPHFPNEKKEKKEKKTTRKYVITFTRSTGNIFGDYSLKFRVTPFFSSPHCLSPRSQTLPLARLSLPTSPRSVNPSPLEFGQGPEKRRRNWAGWQQRDHCQGRVFRGKRGLTATNVYIGRNFVASMQLEIVNYNLVFLV